MTVEKASNIHVSRGTDIHQECLNRERSLMECSVINRQSFWPAFSLRGGSAIDVTFGVSALWRYYMGDRNDRKFFVTGGPDVNAFADVPNTPARDEVPDVPKGESDSDEAAFEGRVGGQVGIGYHRFDKFETQLTAMIHENLARNRVEFGFQIYLGFVGNPGRDGHFGSIGMFAEVYPQNGGRAVVGGPFIPFFGFQGFLHR